MDEAQSVGRPPVSTLRELIDAAPDAIVAVDQQGRIAIVNQQAVLLFGYTAEQLVGVSVDRLVPPDLRDRHHQQRSVFTRDPAPRPMGALRAVEAVRRDGTTIPVEISLSSVSLDTGPLVVASVRDVTARREAEERVERLSRLYAMLASADAAILRADSPAEVYEALCRVVADQGDFPLAWVGLPGDDGLIRPVASAGEAGGYVEGLVVALDTTGPTASAITLGTTVVVDDVMSDSTFTPWRVRAGSYGLRSACSVPLTSGGRILASFSTYLGEVSGFDAERVQLLERLAADVSFALESLANRHAEAEAREAQRRSEAHLQARAAMQEEVARLGQLALTNGDLDVVFGAIVDGVTSVLGVDGTVVEQVEVASGGMTLRAAHGVVNAPLDTTSAGSPTHSFGGRLVDAGEPIVIEDLDDHSHSFRPDTALAHGMRSGVGVLIEKRGEVYGALITGSRQPRRYDADEVSFLRSVANIAAASVERSEVNDELMSLALHDSLTGLPNRSLLNDRLTHAIDRADRGQGMVAVLLVDLDGFKLVNDALGHDVGDELLVAVAARLAGAVRQGDTVARLGGDEFAVLCEDVAGPEEATGVADRIAAAMAAPFRLGAIETFVTASTGITIRSGAGTPPEMLLREADAAMYRAKEAGRARSEVFDDRMRERAVQRLDLTNALRRATEREEFRLVWHPELPLAGDASPRGPLTEGEPGHGVWAEALLRWHHPVHGIITPDRFIGLAEDSGLIAPIGEWVLREACRQLRAWQSDGGLHPEVISVNVSARQLAQPDLVSTVGRVLEESDIDPRRVVLEITETAVMSDPRSSISRLRALRELGLGLAIDDFGTGYSSMSYLRDLPVDALKIDRSFVGRLGSRDDHRAIVEGIVGLAHAVGLCVIAEGVETSEQLDALRAMGCDRAQGFFWTRPLQPEALGPWLVDWSDQA